MKELLEKIRNECHFAIPKDGYSLETVKTVFQENPTETNISWLVSCSQIFFPPATSSEIKQTENELGFAIPTAYKTFLQITNGANLYATNRQRSNNASNSIHARFRLFSCRDLVEVHSNLLDAFRQGYANDPEFSNVHRLNYLAFCDAEDSNFQSLLLDNIGGHRVFMLFHELMYRPFSELDAKWYYTISMSLHSWFELILASGGWEGEL